MLNADLCAFIYFELPLEHLARRHQEGASLGVEVSRRDVVNVHVLLVAHNLTDLHLLRIPESHLAHNRHSNHLLLRVVEVKSSALLRMSIINAFELHCLGVNHGNLATSTPECNYIQRT